MAVYLKPLNEACLGCDPVRAVFEALDVADGAKTTRGLNADDSASNLPLLAKAVLSLENNSGLTDTKRSVSLSSSLDCWFPDP